MPLTLFLFSQVASTLVSLTLSGEAKLGKPCGYLRSLVSSDYIVDLTDIHG